MKKPISLAVIIVLVLIAASYFVFFHKTKTTTTSSTGSRSIAAINNAIVVTKTSSSLGQYLAEPNGMPLYTYGGDSAGSGSSACSGSCLASWPAYQDKGAKTGLPANFGTITRSDNGQLQFTYHGLPLYTFTGDSSGQVTGNGLSNFTIAKPLAASQSSSTGQTTTSSSTTNTNYSSGSSSTGSSTSGGSGGSSSGSGAW